MTIHSIPAEAILDDLCQKGYAIFEDFLSLHAIQMLVKEAKAEQANGHLAAAKVGRQLTQNAEIRTDAIAWLPEKHATASVAVYFQQMLALKQQINQNLFMGLQTLEAHFAIYPAGGGYQKHLDQFQADPFSHPLNSQPRQLSSVLYLNQDWQTDDGGELRLYIDEQNHVDILPNTGKLVLFLSGRFWHEVRPAKRERMSISGWFK